jgi:hypothetical protein
MIRRQTLREVAMRNRKRAFPFLVPLMFGLLSLSIVLSRPTVQSMRAVDIVELIATGMCFGAGLVVFVFFLRDHKAGRV